MTTILGISAYYHDSAAALVEDGQVVCAVQEERFTRIKNDPSFPANAVKWCLGDRTLDDVDAVVYYDKPFLKMERLLETFLRFAPFGLSQFVHAMPAWTQEKLFLKQVLKRELSEVTGGKPRELLFTQHHQSHAGSAFYPSPFERAAVLCVDGVGEWTTTSTWVGRGNTLTPGFELRFPHSLGLLYSAFTYFCGFEVLNGEYKLMGLAPFGEPKYRDLIQNELIDIKADGTFRLNLDYFAYCTGDRMTSPRFDRLFGAEPRSPDEPVRQLDMDLAASIQRVTEDIMLALAATLSRETGEKHLCLAGGVALNCVANGKIRSSGLFEDIWAQPASGDAGGALGAALCAWHEHFGGARSLVKPDAMKGSLLGPSFTDIEITEALDAAGGVYESLTNDELMARTAALIAEGNVVGWFRGASEFGPRALGHRSILGDARDEGMQRTLNLKIKDRESFRPFAPLLRRVHSESLFESGWDSPYMLFVDQLRPELLVDRDSAREGVDRVNDVRSIYPAVTHLDNSARLQTCDAVVDPDLDRLLLAFEERTGAQLVINTSFNVRDEPIVLTPYDAYRCFRRTAMDALVVGNTLLLKTEQGEFVEREPELPEIPETELRRFARTLSIAVILLLGLLLPFLLDSGPWLPAIAAGLVLGAWGELAPAGLRGFHRGWFRFAAALSRLTAPILLSLVYLMVVTPLGWLKRIVGASRIRLGFDASRESYRETPVTHDMIDPF